MLQNIIPTSEGYQFSMDICKHRKTYEHLSQTQASNPKMSSSLGTKEEYEGG
jgi:hypothetical protein